MIHHQEKVTACYRRGKQHCSPFLLNNRPHYHYISMATSIEKTLLSPQRQRQHLPQGKGHSEVKIISYHIIIIIIISLIIAGTNH